MASFSVMEDVAVTFSAIERDDVDDGGAVEGGGGAGLIS